MFREVANGRCDAAPALQEALDRGGEINIPGGNYLLGDTLRVHSNTSMVAASDATFFLADGVGKHSRNFMITNANPGNGNDNITLQGGRWDANGPGNPRGPDRRVSGASCNADCEPFAYSGVALNFTNVRNLTLRDLTVRNPESFFIRVGEVCDFRIENIWLSADTIRPNQDGIHVGGYSERGVIRGIRASGSGVPNDDLVALNADDDVERQLNLGLRRGPIRELLIEDIEAEDAYTFIRLLSVSHPIEDITVRKLRGGCRVHGINLNNWRFPKGVGVIRRVCFEDIKLAKTELAEGVDAIIKISLSVDSLKIRHLQRRHATLPAVKTLVIDNNQHLEMKLNGQACTIPAASGFTMEQGDIETLYLNRGSSAE